MQDRTSLTSEQQAAAYAPYSVIVTAGAGTGKTHMLAERYVYYLREKNLSPLAIVAVTFTEKAATELRSRIRNLVRQQLPERSDILAELEAAQISTIHALCSRICQEHYQVIDLPADFKVLEDLEGKAWLDECLSAGLIKLPRQLYQLISYSLMSDIIDNLLDDPHTATKALKRGIGDWNELIVKAYKTAIHRLTDDRVWQQTQKTLRQHQGKEGDKLEKIRQNVVEAIANIESKQNIEAALTDIDKINLRVGSKKKWQDESLKTVKEALGDLRDLIREVKKQGLFDLAITETDKQLKAMLPAINEAYLEVSNYLDSIKQQARTLTFNDLEIYALKSLQNPLVKEYYQQRWQVFLVDEFQDTNPAQAELLTSLTERAESTIVGDIKQSIYGFRRADIRVFREFRDRLLNNGGKEVVLSQSFRIHQQLSDRLNQILAPLLATDYQPLNAERQPPQTLDTEYIKVLAIDADNRQTSKAQRQRLEANLLAARLKQMLVAQTPVYDKQTRQLRPIEPRDIAILTRTWQPLETYATALAALGIPVAPAGGGNLLDTREAKDASALLRFLANPRDDLALVALLRSPWFAVSDRVLFQIETETSYAKEKVTWWQKVKTSEISEIEHPAKILQRLLEIRYAETPSRLLQLADRLTGYTAVIANLPGAERRQADWQGFSQLVRELERGTRDLFGVVRRLKSLFDNEVTVPRPILAMDNAVSLMTIFAAKGLEWSLVVVADLSREYSPPSPSVYFDSQWGVAVKVKDAAGETQKPVLYCWLEYCQQQREEAEALRILYVALTRARDYLILSATELDKGDLKRLSPGLTVANIPIETIAFESDRALPPIPLTPPVSDVLPPLLLNSAGANLSELPVSALTEYARCPQRFYQHFVRGHPGMGEGMSYGMQLGSLVHKALEHNIIRIEKLQAFAETNCDRDTLATALAIAKQFFQLPMYQYFRDTAVAKERHISIQIGQITFNGIVDLIGHDWVLDYKSDRQISPKEHRFQLGVYARALNSHQAHIAYLRHQYLHTFTKAELDAIARETETLVQQIDLGNYTATPTIEKCAICPYLALCDYAAF